MPSAADYTNNKPIKIMMVGASGSGKTGALTSLVKAGYKLRIVDYDAGLDALINHVQHECSDKIGNIGYMSFRDKMKMTPRGPVVDGAPNAYVNSLKALEKWEDGTDPAAWGHDTVLAVDSLTNAGRAAFQWARAMNPTSKEPRQWYASAQGVIEDLIANLTSDAFNTNVIVMTHIDIAETGEGMRKAFASSIGKALGPKLPRFFNSLVMAETKGSGANVKRIIKTTPTALMDLKTPAPMRIEAEYPLESGLATLFEKLKK